MLGFKEKDFRAAWHLAQSKFWINEYFLSLFQIGRPRREARDGASDDAVLWALGWPVLLPLFSTFVNGLGFKPVSDHF